MSLLPTVACIVPRLPPVIDGIGDYALKLAKQLRNDFGLQTHFIVCDPSWHGELFIDDFSVDQLGQRTSQSLLTLLSVISPSIILLHYVNYGYAKRGCPVWLINGLKHWRAAFLETSLTTMFHEVAAFGPPWRSSFWLSPAQYSLSAQLARLSDNCLTSKSSYAQTLGKWKQIELAKIPSLPVFSNLGEPSAILPLNQRSRRLVVFGGRGWRRKAYLEAQPALIQTCEFLEVEEIWDVGAESGLDLSKILKCPVLEAGKLPAAEISLIMSNSIAGFLSYPPDFLAKSGIFAAYCAHGLLPVCAWGRYVAADGLEARKHFWTPNSPTEQANWVQLQTIADFAHTWYQSHSLSAQAKAFYRTLTKAESVNLPA